MGWIAARVDLKSLLSESRQMPGRVLPGPEFPLERAARQGDRVVPAGRQEHPQTVELQFAAGEPVPPRGEVDRAIRNAPGTSWPARTCRGGAAQGLLRARAGLLQGGLLDHRRVGAVKIAETDASPRSIATCSTSTSRRRTGARPSRGAQARGEAQRNYQRRSRTTSASSRITKHIHAAPRRRTTSWTGPWRPTASACGPKRRCAASGSRARARHEEAIGPGNHRWSRMRATGLRPKAWWRATRRWGRRRAFTLAFAPQNRSSGLDLSTSSTKASAETRGATSRVAAVRDRRRNPTLVGLDRLIDAAPARAAGAPAGPAAHESLVQFARPALSVYLCSQCGFKARQFYLQCPACGGWETFPASHGGTGDGGRHLARCRLDNRRVIVDTPISRTSDTAARHGCGAWTRASAGEVRQELFVAPARGVERLHGARFRGVPRPQVPRHPQYRRRPAVRGAAGVWMLKRARERRRADDACARANGRLVAEAAAPHRGHRAHEPFDRRAGEIGFRAAPPRTWLAGAPGGRERADGVVLLAAEGGDASRLARGGLRDRDVRASDCPATRRGDQSARRDCRRMPCARRPLPRDRPPVTQSRIGRHLGPSNAPSRRKASS